MSIRSLLALGLAMVLMTAPLGTLQAQRSSGTPSGDSPRTQIQPTTPGLRATTGPSCFRPGDLVMVEGQGLSAAQGYSLSLELPAGRLDLAVVAWQGTRLIARLGDDLRLVGGQRYRLVLTDRLGRAVGKPPRIFLVLCQAVKNAAEPPGGQQAEPAVAGEVTLLLSGGGEDPQPTIAALGYGIEERVLLAALGQEILRLSVPTSKTLGEAVDELRAALPDATIDVNSLYELQADPRLYAKRAIGWPVNALQCADGGRGSRIGLIDGSLDQSHPAFAGRHLVPKSFLKNGAKPAPLDHATGIAAILIGKPGGATDAGLLPAAHLYVAQVFSQDRRGKSRASTIAVVQALDWLAGEKLRVVNLSFAGPQNSVLSAGLAQADRQGMILIAASGNNGPDAPPAYPAADVAVIAVTAVDSRNHLYAKANRGGYIDFAAPGVDVWTARAGGGGAYRNGTSFAAPYVAAVVAVELARNQRLSAGLLKESMRRGALDLGPAGKDPRFGWGLIQLGTCAE